MVTDGVNGLVVPPGDPNALAAALERMSSDPALRERLGRQAMADSSRYDIARAAAEIEGIYTAGAGLRAVIVQRDGGPQPRMSSACSASSRPNPNSVSGSR